MDFNSFEEFLEWEIQQDYMESSIQILRNGISGPLKDEDIIARNLDDQKRHMYRDAVRKRFLENYRKSSAQQDKDLTKQLSKELESALSKLFK